MGVIDFNQMKMGVISNLAERQIVVSDPNGREERSWWFSSTGYIIKYSILTGLFVIFMIWFIGGYMHAQRRLRKGLPLLAYHRWLVPSYQRNPNRYHNGWAYNRPQHGGYYGNHPPNSYGMQGYQEPPPIYDSSMPPTYQPPAGPPPGATKANPEQRAQEPTQ